MAFLGEKRLYDGILRKLRLSMVFLGLECLSMAFHRFSLFFIIVQLKCSILCTRCVHAVAHPTRMA